MPPLDPNLRRYYPDIQIPQQSVPAWVPMEDDQPQGVSIIPGNAFKRRLTDQDIGGGRGGADAGGGAPTTWSGGDVASKGGGAPGSKGGFRSL